MLALVLAVALPPAPAPRAKAETAVQAVTKALPLLVAAAEGHADQKTCFACHNQAFPMMAFAAAKGRGLELPKNLLKDQTDHVIAFVASNREKFRKGEGTGGQVDTAGYAMLTLELGGHKPDENTEAVVEYFLKTQPERDHWRAMSNRPPTEASHFTPTYLAIRAIKFWGLNDQKDRGAKRIEAARAWLLKTPAKDTEDRVFRLLALKEAGADETAIAAAAWELLRTQKADGGWAQLPSMETDAYATATSLVALHQAGGLAADHPAYARGVGFLVKRQRTDGSWHIASRSKPFQPYYESGFPHGKDQFISAATSGWATTALILGTPR
ncbi:MAG: prenyltransferase/squalene oxidase repeat-containing protein [Gemmataceae bacterium]